MIVITYIYAENERTKQTIESFQRFGYEVAIVLADSHRGNGEVMRQLLECYKRASTGHDRFVYCDAADSFCQRKFFIPNDRIIYSTEKACYPHTWVASKYPEVATAYGRSAWKFLNGGGYGGSLKLMIEFMERYIFTEQHIPNDCNGQHEQMVAYIEAKKNGFPIHLDDGCELFQTMAFADPSEFEVKTKLGELYKEEDSGGNMIGHRDIESKYLFNKVTNNIPAILHFNGLTDMSILKELK